MFPRLPPSPAGARAAICSRGWPWGGNCRQRGCAVTLLVSSKEIDRQAAAAAGDVELVEVGARQNSSMAGASRCDARTAQRAVPTSEMKNSVLHPMEVLRLPAVGLGRGNALGFFLWRFWQSYRLSIKHFKKRPPGLVLAMGGFVSAPPVLAGKRSGAKTFLHESNSVPGRANRWLARWVDGAFVYFPTAAERLPARRVEVSGMPVRAQFLNPLTPPEARTALGLKPEAPLLLIMGGSQGASKVNQLVLAVLPQLRQAAPDLQFMHLTGPREAENVRAAYRRAICAGFGASLFRGNGSGAGGGGRRGQPRRGFLPGGIGGPAAAGGADSLSKAADNHQYFNALAFARSGAARRRRTRFRRSC